jgi:hypothetical protein
MDVTTACSVASCERPAVTRGWCQSHYLRWYRTGDVQPDRPLAQRRADESCTVPGCDRPTRVRGLCPTHFRHRRATAA